MQTPRNEYARNRSVQRLGLRLAYADPLQASIQLHHEDQLKRFLREETED